MELTDTTEKSRRKTTSDLNKALTRTALRTSPKKKSSSGHFSRCFLTADSHWLGTRACAVPAISLRRCQSIFLGISLQRVPHVEAWRVGCYLSSPPRHSTGVPNDTVCMCVELVTNPLLPPGLALSGYMRNKSFLSSSVGLPFP
ncbi:uncharacterized protein TNCV_3813001 [Trichonephila clavipes]|nr:uncharacterized protein TNCV_3813001 [Trichonephila clavipes]